MMNQEINGALSETRKLFASCIGYVKNLTFDEWIRYPEDLKAAALYVNFYDTIVLAHYKSKSFFVQEQDVVEVVLQYLMKNVPVIEANPNRFYEGYIYRVCYNCLYCISHDIKREIDRWEKEVSNIVGYDGQELDLFNTVETNTLNADENMTSEHFWRIIEEMGPETMKVVNYLLNKEQQLGKTSKFRRKDPRSLSSWDKKSSKEQDDVLSQYIAAKTNYELDPLKDIEVTVERAEEIIEELRRNLAIFKDVFYN